MENYILRADETVLYKNMVRLRGKKGKSLEILPPATTVELLLTNLYLVFIKRTKRLLERERIEVEAYPIEEIKSYNESPQIKLDQDTVEIYLLSGEKEVQFDTKTEARKFTNISLELITGKSMAARGADKVKGTMDMVDHTLGIDTIEAAKSVLKNGLLGTALGKKVEKGGREAGTWGEAADAAKGFLMKKIEGEQTKEEDAQEKEIEALKKWKELLDAGVISEEEFKAKKAQILGI